MEVKLSEAVSTAVAQAAQENNMSVDEFVNGLIEYSFDNGLAVLQMSRVEAMLTNEILPRVMNLQMNQYAVRHQVMTLHADISDGPERAIAIAKEANDIGYDTVFQDDKD
ncbi:hypothetical protein [Sulfurospirillum sp. 1612]|uniref:hypothetical protein n=1 Tax=Sulfurospirillum sp. 1612 TaxID=3094835 RepID=UPI002F9226C1